MWHDPRTSEIHWRKFALAVTRFLVRLDLREPWLRPRLAHWSRHLRNLQTAVNVEDLKDGKYYTRLMEHHQVHKRASSH